MKKPNLILYFSVLLTCVFAVASCDKDEKETDIVKNALPVNSAQEVPVPQVPTTATGKMDLRYSKSTKVLTYTITWQNLTSDSIRGMHFHGPADPGVAAPVLQGITGYPLKANGTISGSVSFDGVVMKESDLLSNKLYYNLHTKANPPGEIRGQLTMQ